MSIFVILPIMLPKIYFRAVTPAASRPQIGISRDESLFKCLSDDANSLTARSLDFAPIGI